MLVKQLKFTEFHDKLYLHYLIRLVNFQPDEIKVKPLLLNMLKSKTKGQFTNYKKQAMTLLTGGG